MFDIWLKKYGLDTKKYDEEANLIKDDVSYILSHYKRNRSSERFDLIVIPVKNDYRKQLITDMFINADYDWWENLDIFLPAVDLVESFMNDIETMTTGKREVIIIDALIFQEELNQFTNIDLKKYIRDFIKPEVTASEITNIWKGVK